MTHIQVEGYDNLVRDKKTNAIINTNKTDYEKYLKLKEDKQKFANKINDIETELFSIKDDIREIKEILKNILK
jgi:hypothetical protein